jgi:predicted site-specific integrase-resolvase
MKCHYDQIPDISSRRVLAEILAVHPSTLMRAEKAGKLQATRVSARNIIYQKNNVLKWLFGLTNLSK